MAAAVATLVTGLLLSLAVLTIVFAHRLAPLAARFIEWVSHGTRRAVGWTVVGLLVVTCAGFLAYQSYALWQAVYDLLKAVGL